MELKKSVECTIIIKKNNLLLNIQKRKTVFIKIFIRVRNEFKYLFCLRLN